MKHRLSILITILALFAFLFTAGRDAVARGIELPKPGTPATISYQGYIKVNGNPYNGSGYFKFAILDSGGASRWSNDGTSSAGSQPASSIQLAVSNGMFSILLGDTSLAGMTQPLTADVFATDGMVLRVWFSADNTSFTLLTPDRILAAVPFAFQAQQAANAGLLDGFDSADFSLSTHNHNADYVNDNSGEVDDNDITAQGLSPESINGTAWTTLNDGVNSLLDADLLDGHDSADFSLSTHNHNADYVNDNSGEVDDNDITAQGLSPESINGTAWTTLNDGVNSLLDADLLDGHDSADFSLSTHNHNATYVNDNSGEVDDNDIIAQGLSPESINGTAWTTLNDGVNSLLDADLLDGQDSSYFQRRVSDTCTAGSTIRAVNADGTLVCEPHITRPAYTDLTAPASVWNSGMNSSITVGMDGLPVVGFRDYSHGALKFIHCNDLNCASSTTKTLQQSNNTGFGTQMTIGSDGYPVISFADDGFTTGNLYVLHCQDALCDAFSSRLIDPQGVQRWGQSITIGNDSFPLISYYDVTNQNLLLADCEDVSCDNYATRTIDTAVGTDWSYTSITIGIDGFPVISYFDPINTSLKFVHCTDPECTTWDAARTLAGAGAEFEGFYNQIAIGFDGLPAIVYGEANSLKFLHCGNITCSTVTDIQTLFPTAGTWPSLAIGTDGLPIISFYDWNSKDLELIHCNNINCASWSRFTLEGAGDSGATNSLTIGADGLPIIAYYQESPLNSLRVLHCANQTCAPYWRRR